VCSWIDGLRAVVCWTAGSACIRCLRTVDRHVWPTAFGPSQSVFPIVLGVSGCCLLSHSRSNAYGMPMFTRIISELGGWGRGACEEEIVRADEVLVQTRGRRMGFLKRQRTY